MGCLYGGILAFCLILPSVTDNIDSDSVFNMVQERLNRSLMVCQDKYEAARLQKKNDAMNDFVSCADQSIQENIKTLPHLANKLKASYIISFFFLKERVKDTILLSVKALIYLVVSYLD